MNGLRIIFTHGGKSQCLVMLTKQTALYVKGVSNLRQWESRRRNMLSGKHREYVRAHQQVPIASFCFTLSNNVIIWPPNNVWLYANTQRRGDLDAEDSDEPQLIQIKWWDWRRVQSQGPDPGLVQTFTCGKDVSWKSTYSRSHKSTFVIMFDESLNQTTPRTSGPACALLSNYVKGT